MADREDLLLREVDDELKQDQTVAFFKRWGPALAIGGIVVIGAVAGVQIRGGMQDRSAAEAAATYIAAVDESETAPMGGSALVEATTETPAGYRALAQLRAAALLAGEGQQDRAVQILEGIANDGALPGRIRDFARLRAALLLLDSTPARADALAAAVETPTMLGLAREIRALTALHQQDPQAAYDIYRELAAGTDPTISPAVLARAELMAPVADAARRGVPLEATMSEAEAFIQSFSEQLEAEQAAETGPAASENGEPEAGGDVGDMP